MRNVRQVMVKGVHGSLHEERARNPLGVLAPL